LEQKKEEELNLANKCLADIEDFSVLTEENLEHTQTNDAQLKKILAQIAEEQDTIESLRARKEELLVAIEEAKSRKSTNVEVDLSTENDPNPSSADAVATAKPLPGQTDFRALLKKRNNAPASAEKPPAVEPDQKDFRNLLKKRN